MDLAGLEVGQGGPVAGLAVPAGGWRRAARWARRGPGGPGGGAGLADTSALQAPLKATNEEWLVIGPMLQRLQRAQQSANATGEPTTNAGGRGRGGGMGNDTFGGPGRYGDGQSGRPRGRGGRGAWRAGWS